MSAPSKLQVFNFSNVFSVLEISKYMTWHFYFVLIDSVLSSYIYYFQVFIKQGNVALWYVFWFGIKNTQQTWLKVLFLPLLMNILFLYDIDYMSHHLWMCAVLYKISETTLKHILIPSNFKIAYYIF